MVRIKSLFAFAALLLTVISCQKDPISGGGDKDVPQLLTNNDFLSSLTLEDRNSGVDYYIDQTINMDHDLVIKPGVVIEFGENGGISIRESGSIEAKGLSDKGITFSGRLKSKGSWKGILVQSTSLKNVFKHCIFEFAGKDGWGNDVTGALGTWAEASMNVDDCVFRNNKVRGVSLYQSANVELRSFENNVFENNDLPIKIDPATVHQLGNTNTFADLKNVIEVYEDDVFDDESPNITFTWKAQPIPYAVQGVISIRYKGNLTIEGGAVLEFNETAYLDVNDASLTIKGTASKPVTLTGSSKSAGSWGGLAFAFTSSSKNSIEHTIIEYAGSNVDEFENGAIYMWASPVVSFKNCTFKEITTCVFNSNRSPFDQPNLTEQNNSFVNTGSKTCN